MGRKRQRPVVVHRDRDGTSLNWDRKTVWEQFEKAIQAAVSHGQVPPVPPRKQDG